MHTSRLILLIVVAATALAGCAGAPAQPSANGVTAPPAATVVAPTVAPAPTAASAPATGIVSTAPNDATQARLRVSQCVYGAPEMEVYVNGKVPVDADVPLSYLGAGSVSRYEYLAPGSYSVAVVPTGMGVDKAFLGPLDVPMVAGHRYTVVALGQADEASHKALVIDETDAYQAIGATPAGDAHITVNNIKGVQGIDFSEGGIVRDKDVPYGGFKAAIWPVGNFKDLAVTGSGMSNQVIDSGADGFNTPGTDTLDCFGGHYPGTMGQNFDTHTSPSTSLLNAIDFLRGASDEATKNGGRSPSFKTFLAALEITGLTQMLATGGPYLLFPPTDEAFAALPKATRDALLTDPKVLADVLRAHIVEGYYPPATLITGRFADRFERTVSNMLGAKLALSSSDGLYINGDRVGGEDTAMVANGTRIFFQINKVLLPVTK
jgi:uncharacterized surface protein with fasciclin (FAS1) repeats